MSPQPGRARSRSRSFESDPIFQQPSLHVRRLGADEAAARKTLIDSYFMEQEGRKSQGIGIGGRVELCFREYKAFNVPSNTSMPNGNTL